MNPADPSSTVPSADGLDTTDGRSVERPHPLTPLVQSWIMVVAMAVWLGQNAVRGELPDLTKTSYIIWIALGLALISLTIGIISWIGTRFVADDDEFRIDHTFIWHSSDKISYTKIQSVDVQQPFAARLIGLAKLHIDVGGGSGKSIEFLTRKRAYALRDHLMAKAHGRTLTPTLPDEPTPAPSWTSDLQQVDEVLVRATPLNLVLSGVGSNAFIVLLALLVFFIVEATLSGGWTLVLASLVPASGLLYARIAANWNYTLARTPHSLKVTRGLTSLSSQSVPTQRIQGIRISAPLLCRALGLWQVQVTVLGYGLAEDASETSNLIVPAGTWRDVEAALHAIWPGFALTTLHWQHQPPPARWLTWFTYRTRGWALGERVFATRRGLLTSKIDLVPYARSQGVTLRQGPLQRRLGLAKVTVGLSLGVVDAEAGHLLEPDARALAERLADAGRAARASDLELAALLTLPAPSASDLIQPANSAGVEQFRPFEDDRHLR